MAKNKEKRIAFDYYTTQGMTAKAIAEIIGVTEKTVGNWVKDGNWKATRDAILNNSASAIVNFKELITHLTERRLEIEAELKEAATNDDKSLITDLRKEASAISQETAIIRKNLEKYEKENKIDLSNYLLVMNDIFQALKEYDEVVYRSTLDFQESHLQTISLKLG